MGICNVKEHKVANLVFEYESIYDTLANIEEIIEECFKFDQGIAYLTLDGDQTEAWGTIDLNDFNWAYANDDIVAKKGLIIDIVDNWSNGPQDWEADEKSIEEQAEFWRD